MLKIGGNLGVLKLLMIRTYHLVPLPLRRRAATIGPIAWLRRRYVERDTGLHDEYYTAAYYEEDCGATRQSAPAMCQAMLRYLRPADVLDVGCGTGEYLEAFRDAGVPARGVELAIAALEQCRAKGLDVARFDLSKGQELPWTADLVFSFEVAEHIPEDAANGFVGALTAAAQAHLPDRRWPRPGRALPYQLPAQIVLAPPVRGPRFYLRRGVDRPVGA